VQQGLRVLAGVCDYAQAKDEVGFNAIDARIGHVLAEQSKLSPKQAVLGKKVLRKYKRQLGNLWLQLFATEEANESRQIPATSS
jgi:hypothetical protein